LAAVIVIALATRSGRLHPFPALLIVATGFGFAGGLSTSLIGKAFGAGFSQAIYSSGLAIVAAGYGDGLPRSLVSGAPVQVGSRRGEVVGRVSMDMIAVDVTELPPVHVGTDVVLWGAGLPVEEVARHAGTVPYELLCSVSQRVPLELR